jgi:glycosyltransferase involved in cell wall biosynthesis
MTKMRIAVWHNLPSGGGKRALYDHVRGLLARGHEVEIWCPSTADQTFLPLGKLATEHVLPLDWQIPPPRSRIGWILQPYHKIAEKLARMDRHCLECAEQINQGGFDVVLAHPCVFFRTSPIGHHVDPPTCIYLQEPYREFYEAMPKLPWVGPPSPEGRITFKYIKEYIKDIVKIEGKRLQVREEQAWASGFDTILVNSYFSRESVSRAYGLNSRVCYLGVDTERFRPSGAGKEPYVIGLGNIYENKGLDLAIKAVGTIEEACRPELVWVGNFAEPVYLSRIEQLAHDSGVRFIPKVLIPDDQLVDHLSRATAMVYTSYLEPFGYAPLEANSCGTAVVAVAEGGVRETIRDGVNGILVGDKDPLALGAAIRELLVVPGRASALGRSARRHIEEHWSLEASIDRLESFLDALCGSVRQKKMSGLMVGTL